MIAWLIFEIYYYIFLSFFKISASILDRVGKLWVSTILFIIQVEYPLFATQKCFGIGVSLGRFQNICITYSQVEHPISKNPKLTMLQWAFPLRIMLTLKKFQILKHLIFWIIKFGILNLWMHSKKTIYWTPLAIK